jgi:hypothetical protein
LTLGKLWINIASNRLVNHQGTRFIINYFAPSFRAASANSCTFTTTSTSRFSLPVWIVIKTRPFPPRVSFTGRGSPRWV